MLSTDINITETTYSCQFYMYLVINKCVTAVKVSKFSSHYLRNRSTLDRGVWVISVYFNIRNTLPKSGTFILGHPVYTESDMLQ